MEIKYDDSAYAEIKSENLHNLIKEENCKFKMLSILCSRIEISDPKYVDAIKMAIADIVASNEVNNLDDEQIGFYIFKKIFEKGLENWISE